MQERFRPRRMLLPPHCFCFCQGSQPQKEDSPTKRKHWFTTTATMASHPETKIDCSKVYVKQSTFSNEQTGMFDGAFAAVPIKEGDLVEKGVMRRLPEGFDGNTCPYIFTWSTERPNKTWGMGSGCAPFYNTCKEGTANTRMVRFFDEDRFEIYATRDIEAGEELLHTYISLKWRTCFSELNEIVHADDSEHKTMD